MPFLVLDGESIYEQMLDGQLDPPVLLRTIKSLVVVLRLLHLRRAAYYVCGKENAEL